MKFVTNCSRLLGDSYTTQLVDLKYTLAPTFVLYYYMSSHISGLEFKRVITSFATSHPGHIQILSGQKMAARNGITVDDQNLA